MNKATRFSLGSQVYPGLSKLVEEAGEVQQVAGKLMGNGGQPAHWDGTNLRIRIAEEVADLSAACRVFFQLNGYDGAPWVLEREHHKFNQFHRWHADNLEDRPDDTNVVKPGYNRFERLLGAGSDQHYQLYWAWRVYPSAMRYTSIVFFALGSLVANALWFFTR